MAMHTYLPCEASHKTTALMAQSVARSAVNRKVPGSSPGRSDAFFELHILARIIVVFHLMTTPTLMFEQRDHGWEDSFPESHFTGKQSTQGSDKNSRKIQSNPEDTTQKSRDQIDPARTANNEAIMRAASCAHVVIRLLLSDELVDLSSQNSKAIIHATFRRHIEIVPLFMFNSRVDPSAQVSDVVGVSTGDSKVTASYCVDLPGVIRNELEQSCQNPLRIYQFIIKRTSYYGPVNVVRVLLTDERAFSSESSNESMLSIFEGHLLSLTIIVGVVWPCVKFATTAWNFRETTALMAQSVARSAVNRKVPGSSPALHGHLCNIHIHKLHALMIRPMSSKSLLPGLEPGTFRLTAERATDCAIRAVVEISLMGGKYVYIIFHMSTRRRRKLARDDGHEDDVAKIELDAPDIQIDSSNEPSTKIITKSNTEPTIPKKEYLTEDLFISLVSEGIFSHTAPDASPRRGNIKNGFESEELAKEYESHVSAHRTKILGFSTLLQEQLAIHRPEEAAAMAETAAESKRANPNSSISRKKLDVRTNEGAVSVSTEPQASPVLPKDLLLDYRKLIEGIEREQDEILNSKRPMSAVSHHTPRKFVAVAREKSGGRVLATATDASRSQFTTRATNHTASRNTAQTQQAPLMQPPWNAVTSTEFSNVGGKFNKKNALPDPRPIFKFSPEKVSFTEYEVGGTYEQVISVKNISPVSKKINVMAPSGRAAFTVTNLKYPHEEGLLAAGMVLLMTVRFCPKALSTVTDRVILRTGDEERTSLVLTGQKSSPSFNLPSAFDCGFCVATMSTRLRLDITNSGEQDPDDGESVGIFSVCPSETEVHPNETISIEIHFFPSDNITYSARLCIESENSKHTMKLEGRGSHPHFSIEEIDDYTLNTSQNTRRVLSVASDFGETTPGAIVQKKFNLSNQSNLPLDFHWEIFRYESMYLAENPDTILSSLQWIDHPHFSVEPSAGLFPSGRKDFIVRYDPDQLGDHCFILRLVVDQMSREQRPQIDRAHLSPFTDHEGSRSIAVAEIQANGRSLGAKVLLKPQAIIVPKRLVVGQPFEQEVRVHNDSHAEVSYEWMDGFCDIQPKKGILRSKGDTIFRVSMQPDTAGAFHHTMMCKIDHSKPVQLYIQGEVERATLSVSPNFIDFSTVKLGSQIERTFYLNNPHDIEVSWEISRKACRFNRGVTEVSLSPMSGVIPARETQTVIVTATCQALERFALAHSIMCWTIPGSLSENCLYITGHTQLQKLYIDEYVLKVQMNKCFVGMPVQRTMRMHNPCPFVIRYHWEIGESNGDSWRIDALHQTIEITIDFFPISAAEVDALMVCHIEDDDPIGINVLAHIQGLQISYALTTSPEPPTEELYRSLPTDMNQEGRTMSVEALTMEDEIDFLAEKEMYFHIKNESSQATKESVHLEKEKSKMSSKGFSSLMDTQPHAKKEAEQALKDGLGLAYIIHVEKSAKEGGLSLLPPFMQKVIKITCYNDMVGRFTDVLHFYVEGMKARFDLPLTVSVVGSPLSILHNTLGVIEKGDQTIMNWGSVSSGAAETYRTLRITNHSSRDAALSWTFESSPSLFAITPSERAVLKKKTVEFRVAFRSQVEGSFSAKLRGKTSFLQTKSLSSDVFSLHQDMAEICVQLQARLEAKPERPLLMDGAEHGLTLTNSTGASLNFSLKYPDHLQIFAPKLVANGGRAVIVTPQHNFDLKHQESLSVVLRLIPTQLEGGDIVISPFILGIRSLFIPTVPYLALEAFGCFHNDHDTLLYGNNCCFGGLVTPSPALILYRSNSFSRDDPSLLEVNRSTIQRGVVSSDRRGFGGMLGSFSVANSLQPHDHVWKTQINMEGHVTQLLDSNEKRFIRLQKNQRVLDALLLMRKEDLLYAPVEISQNDWRMIDRIEINMQVIRNGPETLSWSLEKFCRESNRSEVSSITSQDAIEKAALLLTTFSWLVILNEAGPCGMISGHFKNLLEQTSKIVTSSPPEFILGCKTLGQAITHCASTRRMNGIAVADDEGNPKGILRIEDLQMITLENALRNFNTPLDQFLRAGISLVPEEVTIESAASQMKEGCLHRVFVSDTSGGVKGIIQSSDVIRLALEDKTKHSM
ncbi:hypothetical protein PROFUN_03020 [Planoprotostelium fungivorum]|uniref:CBS domain-containing protein n=1 Tax=Planoprotostelium fungivorum TaxID=1890364 RepID=A0A2P6NXD6_9EUKA|nr:hypothetical protein PROFUN_03020 [Planoprotostelium fungivorum]